VREDFRDFWIEASEQVHGHAPLWAKLSTVYANTDGNRLQ
jgi:hypothetical protein